MKWFQSIIAFLKALAGYGEKRETRKTAEIPMKEIEHEEKAQIRKVVHKKIEIKEQQDLINAYVKLKKHELKKGFEVVETEDGEIEVLELDVADKLPEKERIRFLQRRRLKKQSKRNKRKGKK
jgi:hypothetical protein